MDTASAPTTRGVTPASARIGVADAMSAGVLTCPREASLADIAELMASRRVHCVVVTEGSDDADGLWGIVSDLDLVAAASVRDLEEQTAGATAASAALTIGFGETVQRAAQLMAEHGTAHLVVIDEKHRPIGVISTLDVASTLVGR